MPCVCCLRSGCFGGNLGGTWAKAWSLARTTDSALPRKTLTWNELLKHRRAGMLQRHPSKYEVRGSKVLRSKLCFWLSFGSVLLPIAKRPLILWLLDNLTSFTWKENSANGCWNKRDDDVTWRWVVSLETERAINLIYYHLLLITDIGGLTLVIRNWQLHVDHDFYWSRFLLITISIDYDFYWYVFIVLHSESISSQTLTMRLLESECLQVLDSCHNVSKIHVERCSKLDLKNHHELWICSWEMLQ